MPPPSGTSTARNLSSTSHFELTVTGSTLGRFQVCSGLELSFEVYEYAEGGNNEFVHRLPGRLRYPNLVLTYGMTNDKALMDWFWKTRTKAELKEIRIRLMRDNASDPLRTWAFADAYPVRWSGPTLQSGSPTMATEVLEIAHAGLKES